MYLVPQSFSCINIEVLLAFKPAISKSALYTFLGSSITCVVNISANHYENRR